MTWHLKNDCTSDGGPKTLHVYAGKIPLLGENTISGFGVAVGDSKQRRLRQCTSQHDPPKGTVSQSRGRVCTLAYAHQTSDQAKVENLQGRRRRTPIRWSIVGRSPGAPSLLWRSARCRALSPSDWDGHTQASLRSNARRLPLRTR